MGILFCPVIVDAERHRSPGQRAEWDILVIDLISGQNTVVHSFAFL